MNSGWFLEVLEGIPFVLEELSESQKICFPNFICDFESFSHFELVRIIKVSLSYHFTPLPLFSSLYSPEYS
jgi:hypothetical protein